MSIRFPTIREEIRQRRPFRSRGQEALVSLLRTADVLRGRLQAVVEPHGITLQQYNVLRILRGAGESGLPTLAIAERMIERVPGITRLLDRLETKELVERVRSASDRRQVVCTITRAGLALLARLDAPVERSDASVVEPLPVHEQELLLRALDRIRAAAEARPSPSSSNPTKRTARTSSTRRTR